MNKKFFIGLTLIIFAFSSNQVFAISVTGIAKALFGAVAHDSDDVARRTIGNVVHNSDDVARNAGRETQPAVTLGDEMSAHVIKDSSREYAKDYANEKFENAKQDAKNFFFGNGINKKLFVIGISIGQNGKRAFCNR